MLMSDGSLLGKGQSIVTDTDTTFGGHLTWLDSYISNILVGNVIEKADVS